MRPTFRRIALFGLTTVAALVVLLAIIGFTYEQLGRNREAQHRCRIVPVSTYSTRT